MGNKDKKEEYLNFEGIRDFPVRWVGKDLTWQERLRNISLCVDVRPFWWGLGFWKGVQEFSIDFGPFEFEVSW